VKSVTLGKKRYDVWHDAQLMGFADTPNARPTIYIDPTLGGRQHLETVIHEAVHAVFPTATEPEVERKSRDIARLVWGLGYRRTE
jgi:hypothetical protein